MKCAAVILLAVLICAGCVLRPWPAQNSPPSTNAAVVANITVVTNVAALMPVTGGIFSQSGLTSAATNKLHFCTNCPPPPVYSVWTSGGAAAPPYPQIIALTNTETQCVIVASCWLNVAGCSNLTVVLQKSTDGCHWRDYQFATLTNGGAAAPPYLVTFVDTNETAVGLYRVFEDATLNVTNFGAVGDATNFAVQCVSNSEVIAVSATNDMSAMNGKVVEVFGAGPQISWNGQTVVQEQDLIGTVTSATNDMIAMSLVAGKSGTFTATIGTQNAPAFQAAIQEATAIQIEAMGYLRRVNIIVPPGTYLMTSSNVLNPGYVMTSISDTHAALIISSGGIRFVGQGNPTLLGCGAGMEHYVNSILSWISPTYAPYVPMRDTLVILQAPVFNPQAPLVFDGITFDGGVQQGAQSYNYWEIDQMNGSGWDTTHHAFADNAGAFNTPGYLQMHQDVLWTNCVFQHYRGEMCICWAGAAANCWREWDHCLFTDGNATADNMYYGQRIRHCTFDNVGKVMEYYQGNAMNDMNSMSVMSDCLVTNISEVAGPGNVHVDCAITGAVTNRTMNGWIFQNNQFYDNVGMEFFSLNAAENVSFVSNTLAGQGPGINLTGIGQQPSDGTQVWYMTNILVRGNSFSCASPVSIGFSDVENMLCLDNAGFTISASIGYATNIILSGNSGYNMGNGNYDVMSGPIQMSDSPQIATGQYMTDCTNNQWVVSTPSTIDGGDHFTTNMVSYGNGRVHKLQASGSTFYLDDRQPGLIPTNAVLEVYAQTWDGRNCTNVFESVSATNDMNAMTITNGAAPRFFRWSGTSWIAL